MPNIISRELTVYGCGQVNFYPNECNFYILSFSNCSSQKNVKNKIKTTCYSYYYAYNFETENKQDQISIHQSSPNLPEDIAIKQLYFNTNILFWTFSVFPYFSHSWEKYHNNASASSI